MNWGLLITVGIVGLILIAILLKVLSTHYIGILISVSLAAIGIIISSFAMPHVKHGSELDWSWLITQGLFIFLYCVMFCAGFAFDEEEYVETERTTTYEGNGKFKERETSKLETKSMFWSCLGGSLFISVVLVTLNYVIFEKHAIALGVVGCIALAFPLYLIIKHYLGKRKRRNYY